MGLSLVFILGSIFAAGFDINANYYIEEEKSYLTLNCIYDDDTNPCNTIVFDILPIDSNTSYNDGDKITISNDENIFIGVNYSENFKDVTLIIDSNFPKIDVNKLDTWIDTDINAECKDCSTSSSHSTGTFNSAQTITFSCTDSISECKVKYKINDGNEQNYSSPGVALSTSGTYKIVFWGVDAVGHKSIDNNITITLDIGTAPSTPTIVRDDVSIGSGAWTNDRSATFKFSSTGTTKYCWGLDENPSTSISGSNCQTSNTLDLELDEDNDELKVRACNNYGCSNIATYNIRIDVSKPTAPSNISSEVSGRKIIVKWNESDDDESGVDYYEIYGGTTSSFSTNSNTKLGRVENNIEEYKTTNLVGGKTHYIKIVAFDYAGNRSNDSTSINEFIESDGSETKVSFKLLDTNNKELIKIGNQDKIKIRAEFSNPTSVSTLRIQVGDDKAKVFANFNNDSDYIVQEYTLPTDYNGEKVSVNITGLDKYDVVVEENIIFEADTVKPAISADSNLKNNSTVSGMFKLRFKVSDTDSKVEKVEFYFDGKYLGNGKVNNGYYEFDLNTWKYSAESHNLKVKAHDSCGNVAEENYSITVEQSLLGSELNASSNNAFVTTSQDVNGDNKNNPTGLSVLDQTNNLLGTTIFSLGIILIVVLIILGAFSYFKTPTQNSSFGTSKGLADLNTSKKNSFSLRKGKSSKDNSGKWAYKGD